MTEPPVVALYTVIRFAGEYAVVEVRMQGDEVLSREVLDRGASAQEVWAVFYDAAARKFLKNKRVN